LLHHQLASLFELLKDELGRFPQHVIADGLAAARATGHVAGGSGGRGDGSGDGGRCGGVWLDVGRMF
jgi:hypothetical protein